MDLSKLTGKRKSNSDDAQSAGFVKKSFVRVKNWVLPPTSDRRK